MKKISRRPKSARQAAYRQRLSERMKFLSTQGSDAKPITIEALDREINNLPEPAPPTEQERTDKADFIYPDSPPPPVPVPRTETSPVQIAAYVRVSTKDQNASVQVMAIEEYCARRGLPKPYIYLDNATGTQVTRKALQILLGHVAEKRYTVMIAWKLDRIARSMLDLLNIIKLVHAHKCTFVSMTESLDFSTPAGRLMFNMLGAFAEFEAAIISERISAGLHFARAKGKMFGAEWKKVDASLVLEFRQNGLYFSEIASMLSIKESSIIDFYKRVVIPRYFPGADPEEYASLGLGEYRPFGWASVAGVSPEQVAEWASDPEYARAERAEQRQREIGHATRIAYGRIQSNLVDTKVERERHRKRKKQRRNAEKGSREDWRRLKRENREIFVQSRTAEGSVTPSGVQDGSADGDIQPF